MKERFRVLNSSEFPRSLVSPEFTDLGENPLVAKEFGQKYPKLTFAKVCLVDGNVLIQDVEPRPPLSQEIKRLCQELNENTWSTVQTVNGMELTCELLEILSCYSFLFSKKPLVIYPGEAGKIVKEYIELALDEEPNPDLAFLKKGVLLPTQRRMVKPGKFKIELDLANLPPEIKNDSVLVIDDVVATGATAKTIAEKVGERMPKRQFFLASWLFLRPSEKENQKSPSGVAGYERSFCALALKGNYVQRPPINSLSCFIRDDEKGQMVKASYFEKYVWDKEGFNQKLEAIKRIRRNYD